MSQANKPPDGTPSQAEFGQTVSYLAQNGLSPGQIFRAIGVKPNGRSRSQIASELQEWLRENT